MHLKSMIDIQNCKWLFPINACWLGDLPTDFVSNLMPLSSISHPFRLGVSVCYDSAETESQSTQPRWHWYTHDHLLLSLICFHVCYYSIIDTCLWPIIIDINGMTIFVFKLFNAFNSYIDLNVTYIIKYIFNNFYIFVGLKIYVRLDEP